MAKGDDSGISGGGIPTGGASGGSLGGAQGGGGGTSGGQKSSPNAALTQGQIDIIRKQAEALERYRQNGQYKNSSTTLDDDLAALGANYGVDGQTVRDIMNGNYKGQVTAAGKPTINGTKLSDQEFMSKYNAQNPTRTQKMASYDYTDPNPTSTGFSPSQNMNYKLDTGQRLTAKEQRMLDGMEEMSRPIGKDITVYRGAHQNVLEALGVKNYDTMSQAQLQQALVGAQWTTKSLSSTSYDKSKSPFLSGPLAGGREVVMKINVAGSTNATMVNPSQAEVVIGRNTNWQVKNVSFTGSRAYPGANYKRNGYPVVELEIDVWP